MCYYLVSTTHSSSMSSNNMLMMATACHPSTSASDAFDVSTDTGSSGDGAEKRGGEGERGECGENSLSLLVAETSSECDADAVGMGEEPPLLASVVSGTNGMSHGMLLNVTGHGYENNFPLINWLKIIQCRVLFIMII